MAELTADVDRGTRRSRFVTALGSFCLASGGGSIGIRLWQAWQAIQLVNQPGGRDALRRAMGDGPLHPVQAFAVEHIQLMALLQVASACLLFVVGLGLVRRSRWAIPIGAVFIAVGVLRQGSGLLMTMSPEGVRGPQVATAASPELGSLLTAYYLLSLAWLAFVVWKFRQPQIRAEFSK